jgi:hypothetical protein
MTGQPTVSSLWQTPPTAFRVLRRLLVPTRSSPIWRGLAAVAVVIAVGGVGAAAGARPDLLQIAVAFPLACLLTAMFLRFPRTSIVLLLGWLVVFGTIRRLVLPPTSANSNDPLLLIGPFILALLVLKALHRGVFLQRTRSTNLVLGFSCLIVLAALNPLQGGIAVGAGGLLFVLVPVLWFWVGRSLVDDRLLALIFRVIAVLALVAAIYGLFQVYRGFPPWDRRWIVAKGYGALYVGNSLRPFASFASSSEYVGILSVGIVLWALRLRRVRRIVPSAVALAILGWALTVASVRGALVMVPIALGISFAAAHGFGIFRTALVGVAALVALGLLVSRVDPTKVGGAQTSALVSRQITGLSDPLNADQSTLPIHLQEFFSGLKGGLHNPLGRGLGVITIAGQKFGSTNQTTEVDPSNVTVAMGLPGLAAYLAIVLLAFRRAFRESRTTRAFLPLAALGILTVTLFQWLTGGNYSVAPLPWLVLGWLERPLILREFAGGRIPAEKDGSPMA